MAMFEILPRTIYDNCPQLYQQAQYLTNEYVANKYAFQPNGYITQTNQIFQTGSYYNCATNSIYISPSFVPSYPMPELLTPNEDYPLPFNQPAPFIEPLKPITLRPLDLD
jgi:hypothetical protein